MKLLKLNGLLLSGLVALYCLCAGDSDGKRPKTYTDPESPLVEDGKAWHGPSIHETRQPTLSEWYGACQAMESKSIRFKHAVASALDLSLGACDYGVQQIAEDTQEVAEEYPDLYRTPLNKESFDAVFRSYMERFPVPPAPQVCRLDVPQGSVVVLRADLHGDVWSLLEQLREMQRRGYMDENFVITNPQVYMLFLGDFTDRGSGGLEVVYTMLRLKLANPERVILVRGNHETTPIVKCMGFAAEFMHKLYPNPNDVAVAARAFEAFAVWYETMPLAVFLGSTVNGKSDYVQCCHGGIDPAFNAQYLLGPTIATRPYAGGALFAQVDYRNLPDQGFAQAVANSAEFAGDVGATNAVNEYIQMGLQFRSSSIQSYIENSGFLWTDFTFSSDQPSLYDAGRGLFMGQKLAQSVLNSYANRFGGVEVHGVIRGHQHGGENIERYYLFPKGLYQHWIPSSQQTREPKFAIRDGVYTFNVAPNNLYGFGAFDFDTYAYLTIKGPFQNWIFERVNNITRPAI